jgi:glycine C-acetyltransferase
LVWDHSFYSINNIKTLKTISMYGKIKNHLQSQLKEIEEAGLFKKERIITSPQDAEITLNTGAKVLNFCANNYLGLSSHPQVIEGAKKALDSHGYGLSSVRFICGTQDIHKQLEKRIADFFGTEDTILYAACFDANGGVFEPLFDENDAIISDALNHASIIDGVRLSKAVRYRFAHADMEDLEKQLQASQAQRHRIIVTDGVFSMDGDMAKLPKIVDLAEEYGAMVMVDDSHASGYIGKSGRGTTEYYGMLGKVDIITTTFGKALGGGNGGCTSGRKEIIEMLRQKSRPYLFSNSLAPATVGATMKVLEMLAASSSLPAKAMKNAKYFRNKMKKAGFELIRGNTAIVPVMIYDEPLAVRFADELLNEGIYVIGFCYPVVPRKKARIRVQLSAAHSEEEIDQAVDAFIKVGKDLNII